MFIVMGYYEGETLKEKIDRGPMRGAEVLAVTRQVAQGLAKAAKEGIVHRDIKPALARLFPITRLPPRSAGEGWVSSTRRAICAWTASLR